MHTTVQVRLLNDRKSVELLCPVTFMCMYLGTVTVPKGFRTDFASIPRLPFVFLLLGGYGVVAGIVHDYLYHRRITSRGLADLILYIVLRETGHSRWRASIRLVLLEPLTGEMA